MIPDESSVILTRATFGAATVLLLFKHEPVEVMRVGRGASASNQTLSVLKDPVMHAISTRSLIEGTESQRTKL